jgi:hypothetical protein
MLRKVIAAAAIITLLSASAALAGGLLSPAKILGGPGLQEDPAGNGTYLGWSENSQAHPGRYNAYSSDDRGQTKQRVNRAGTRGFFGDIDQDSAEAIYQEVSHGQSDIQMIDLATRVRTDPPSGINTSVWEWNPNSSDQYILFQRDINQTDRRQLILFDRVGQSSSTLLDVNLRTWVYGYDVGASYATWETLANRHWNAWIYDIAGQTKLRIPTISSRPQWAPVVDEVHGNAYWVRGARNGCGQHVRVLEAPLSSLSTPTVVAELPAGVDAYTLSLEYDTANSRVDLLFERVTCRPFRADLYEFQGVDTLP